MTKEDIHNICLKYKITNYTINEDLSIDVDGNVYLCRNNLKELPLRFRNVSGWFDCCNNNLTSLEGAPSSVGDFFACYNNPLQSLNGIPSGILKLYLFLPYDYTYDDYLSYCKFFSRDFKLQKIISKLQ